MARLPERFGLIPVELPHATATSPEVVVRYLVQQLVQYRRLDPIHADDIVNKIMAREALGSTAIGHGVAVPHDGKSDKVGEVVAIVGYSPTPIPWPGVEDGMPVDTVCLIVSPAALAGENLRMLSNIVHWYRDGPGDAAAAT